MHDFCVRYFDTFRGWDEAGAYMFYMLYQNILRYMVNAIEGTSDLKMVMIGGHDITVDKFMNFLACRWSFLSPRRLGGRRLKMQR